MLSESSLLKHKVRVLLIPCQVSNQLRSEMTEHEDSQVAICHDSSVTRPS